ncbi:SDR family oxidoreductase [Candidatus Woesearchaeota archaeon]|nr:SDR family oxidoreductase [Candidatus Woesearchaeota archaeon]
MAKKKEDKDSKKKVLVVGGSGQLGSALVSQLDEKFDVLGTYFFNKRSNLIKLDVTKKDKVFETIKQISPDIIILTSAFTHIDNCEIMKPLANDLNINGVKNVVKAAKSVKAKLVFISSYYVFNGKKEMYSERDKPDPLNHYGITKLQSEEEVSKLDEYMIVRSSKIFDIDDRTYVSSLMSSVKAKEYVNVASDQYTNPITANYLAEIIALLIEKNRKGIFHVGGKQYLSMYSFAKKIIRYFNLDTNYIKPIKCSKIRQIAKRPLKCGLKTDKVEKSLGITIKSFSTMMKDLKKRYKKK